MGKAKIRLPGFVKEDIGLGDVIKKATTFIGIKPCSACNERAKTLNSFVTFTGSTRKEKK